MRAFSDQGSGRFRGIRAFVARRTAWADPGSPLTDHERTWQRAGSLVAVLYIVAPFVGFFSLLLPAEGRHDLWVLGISTWALMSGIATLVLFDRLPPWFWHGVTAAGPFSGALLAYAEGSAAPVILMFLAWQPVYCTYIFQSAATIAYTAMSAAGIGLYAALTYGPSAAFLALGAFPVLLVPAWLVRVMLDHEQRMADALRAAEVNLAATERFETVGRLAAGVAHDFNNVLGVIVGGANLGARRTQDEAARRDFADIGSAAERATELTNQILVLTRGDQLEAVGSPPVCDLAEAVRLSVDLFRSVLPAAVELEVDVTDRAVPVGLRRSEVERIVLNLGLNGSDAMPGGGSLRIAASATDATATLVVTDTGDGMDDETRRRAFEPLFSTKGAAGTGLGLSSVVSLVQAAGGRVLLDSSPGVGTTVTVTLPMTVVAGASPTSTEDAPRDRTLVVLLVDDHATLREVAAEGLRILGHTVIEAVEGANALAQLAAHDIDVVVSDLDMPGMDGEALAEAMDRDHPDVPLVVLSGYVQRPQMVRRVREGRAQLLPKPYSLEALDRAIVLAAG